MPFCYSPWTNIDISPAGDISPCCKFEYKNTQYSQPNIITSDLQEYKNSEFLEEVKNDFLNGDWPKGCERCKVEEEKGFASKRILDYERWQPHYVKYDLHSGNFITAAIAFGNTCNLKCITCRPTSSSRWHTEYKHIYGQDIKPNHFYKENFVEDMTSQCPDLIHIDIPGGEPMVSGVNEQKELLSYYVKNGKAKNISLHYTTNNTIFPDDEWWELWKNFKEIDMQLSIDGIGKINEYIRFPSDWIVNEQSVDNFIEKEKQMENLRLSVSHTVSAYSVLYLDNFFQWCETKQLPKPWLGSVFRPHHMRYSVFPLSLRKKISEHLRKSKFEDIHVWANSVENTDDSEYFSMFLEKTQEHDNYRGTDFQETFPELAEMIANYTKDIIIKQ